MDRHLNYAIGRKFRESNYAKLRVPSLQQAYSEALERCKLDRRRLSRISYPPHSKIGNGSPYGSLLTTQHVHVQ